ncbi:hypothetical protein K440DRAFT_155222 [Wilcoxina mikolae CBS 423.85]|nr:hypothetical protein K440DRAFT_155222 [Wilcoxina mikolae CBS 423.85]
MRDISQPASGSHTAIPHVTPSQTHARTLHANAHAHAHASDHISETNSKVLKYLQLNATMAATATATPTFLAIIYRWFQLLRKPKQDLIAQHYRVLAEEQRGISTAGAPDLENLLPYARTLEEEQRPPYPLDGPSMSTSVEGLIKEARMMGSSGVVP